MEKILFFEQQTLRQLPRIWIIMLISIGAIALPVAMEVNINNNEDIFAIIFSIGLMVIIFAFLMVVRLDTKVSKEGISIKFFPFHRSFRLYRWENISNVTVVKHMILRSRGWGVRNHVRGTRLYNMGGKKGLQLEFYHGRKVFIGTKKIAELEAVLYKIGQLSNK